MSQIPDFTEAELWIIQSTVNERYRAEVRLSLADTRGRVNPDTTELASFPAVFWREQGTKFCH